MQQNALKRVWIVNVPDTGLTSHGALVLAFPVDKAPRVQLYRPSISLKQTFQVLSGFFRSNFDFLY